MSNLALLVKSASPPRDAHLAFGGWTGLTFTSLTRDARESVHWHRVEARTRRDNVNVWDLCHALMRDGMGIAGMAAPDFAEPDLEQQWLTDLEVTAAIRFAGACPSPDGPDQRLPFDRGNLYWFRDGRHAQLDAACGRVGIPDAEHQVRIAHLDTGYDPEHISLPRNLRTDLARNFVDGDNRTDAIDHSDGFFNQLGHGTGTLGILAGNKVDGKFLGGAPHAEIVPIRVASSVVLFKNSTIARALTYVHELTTDSNTPVHVLTMSMGGLASRALAPTVRYCSPEVAPVRPEGVNARIYVLGPPREEKLLKRHRPATRHPETYELAALDFFLDDIETGLREPESRSPFAEPYRIPAGVARETRFFKDHYYRSGGGKFLSSQDWRRIDSAWLHLAPEYALKLDGATNNTSLVLAIELDDGDVLLFPADAQVGSWLSWQTLSWKVNGRKITGPDLLKRTVFYKVGHHGSHNATLRELGLEQMQALHYAMVPVDETVAKKKKSWNRMPLPSLLEELIERAELGVLRIDEDMADKPECGISSNELFHELRL